MSKLQLGTVYLELADYLEVPPSWPRWEAVPFGFGFVSLKTKKGEWLPNLQFYYLGRGVTVPAEFP